MEWLKVVQSAVEYMEQHLLEELSPVRVSREVYVSPFHFQRGFRLLCGYSVGEYIRSRRLYLAALELSGSKAKVIDTALKFGYETPESFTRAFRRFHGASPAAVRQGAAFRTFSPLRVDALPDSPAVGRLHCRIERMEGFFVFGMHRRFSEETSKRKIPLYWEEVMPTMPELQAALPAECILGKYGICVNDNGDEDFSYWIAGDAPSGQAPAGYDVLYVPAMTWAKFACVGPLSQTLQQTNARIFREWLPENPEWEPAAGYEVELYAEGDSEGEDYYCELWVPIQRVR